MPTTHELRMFKAFQYLIQAHCIKSTVADEVGFQNENTSWQHSRLYNFSDIQVSSYKGLCDKTVIKPATVATRAVILILLYYSMDVTVWLSVAMT